MNLEHLAMKIFGYTGKILIEIRFPYLFEKLNFYLKLKKISILQHHSSIVWKSCHLSTNHKLQCAKHDQQIFEHSGRLERFEF